MLEMKNWFKIKLKTAFSAYQRIEKYGHSSI